MKLWEIEEYPKQTYYTDENIEIIKVWECDYLGMNPDDDYFIVKNQGYYGVVDKELNLVIPMVYDELEEFNDGYAKAKRGEKTFWIDYQGNETENIKDELKKRYLSVSDFSDGMYKVSTMNISYMDLSYYCDNEHLAGYFGYVDEKGNEIASPQFIFANDYHNGIAVAAKGEWTIDPKWDNEYNQGCYWYEEELWGAIDKKGNVVIPFIYDYIEQFNDYGCFNLFDYYKVFYKDKWGIMNNHGQWLVEPIFEDIIFSLSENNMIIFYGNVDEKDENKDKLGVYDIVNKRVVLEPIYQHVNFEDDGRFIVKIYDPELDKCVDKVLDSNGKEVFSSSYDSISSRKDGYIVYQKEVKKTGFVDKDGNVCYPLSDDTEWLSDDIYKYRAAYSYKNKRGLKNSKGEVLIPPIYDKLSFARESYIYAYNRQYEGLLDVSGKEIFPLIYSRLYWSEQDYIMCVSNKYEIYQVNKKKGKI